MEYEPFFLAPTQFFQSLFYLMREIYFQNFAKQDNELEFFKVAEGGTMGIEWSKPWNSEKGGKPKAFPTESDRPILLIMPGLGGGTDNLYSLALQWEAEKAGFQTASVMFRGSFRTPITSPHISHSNCWKDAKEAVEYVYNRYCVNRATKKKVRRLYVYGVSLGANILGLYLKRDGVGSRIMIDGALLYATPWGTREGYKFFYGNCMGLYSWGVGMSLNMKIRKY